MPPASARQASARPRLLVVDDSRAMQAILRRALSGPSLGDAQIHTACDGEAALEAVDTFSPNLVITDWHMPRMGGLELLQTLRQLGHRDLPLGLVTTETTPAMLQQARTNGAAFIVHKPFRNEDLLAAVRDTLKPAGEPMPRDPPTLVDTAGSAKVMRRYLQAWMPGVAFRLVDGERVGLDELSAQNLLAHYAPTSRKGTGVLAVANLPALCVLGGHAIQMGADDLRRAIASQNPGRELTDSAMDFFRGLDTMLSHQLPVAEARFKAAELVSREHAPLRGAVADALVRVDYRLCVPGLPDGRLVLIRA